MAHVRDRPSLHESTEIITPSGKRYRWAADEPRAENVPSGDRWSDTMPGGYETFDATFARRPDVDYSDLERLSRVTRYDASGGVIWQGRLERAPRVSGDQISISPSAVGYQAHLDDDKSVKVIHRDISFENWGPPSTERRILVLAGRRFDGEGAVSADVTSGEPALRTTLQGAWGVGNNPISESWYDAGAGMAIGSVYYGWKKSGNISPATAGWTWQVALDNTDDATGTADQSGNLKAAGPGTGALTASTDDRRWARVQFFYTDAGTGAGDATFEIYWTNLIVYGDHGLTLRGTEPAAGFYDADIIRHAIGQWCPLITVTDESVTADPFIIPHSAFRDSTTVGEIVRQTTRFRLRDWAVWEGPTFWLHDRGVRGRRWRARVGPAQLEETGPQVDRLWESIIVQYQDVNGSTRTVGPPGSGVDTESADLKDDDPEIPANKLGIIRRDLLTMGVSTAEGATEIGRQFLDQAKLLDSSGRARLVGHVQDDRGVWHPYSHVLAGDEISLPDASDTSYRRVVRSDKTRADRTATVDLDAPPEGLQALLERLGVVLVPLGL